MVLIDFERAQNSKNVKNHFLEESTFKESTRYQAKIEVLVSCRIYLAIIKSFFDYKHKGNV